MEKGDGWEYRFGILSRTSCACEGLFFVQLSSMLTPELGISLSWLVSGNFSLHSIYAIQVSHGIKGQECDNISAANHCVVKLL